MAERGVVGFKAFMCDSGLAGVSARRRQDACATACAKRRGSVCRSPFTPKSEEMTRALSPAAMSGSSAQGLSRVASGRGGARRDRARVDLAGETGAKLHIVHVSTGSGVAKAAEARARGVDVSVETCPHYLFFTDEDLETHRRRREVRAAAARCRRARGALGRAARRPRRPHRVGSFAVPIRR